MSIATQDQSKGTFNIVLNFPNADKIILSKVNQLIDSYTSDVSSIIPQVLGYQFEVWFLKACNKCKHIKICTRAQIVTLHMELCTEIENYCTELSCGILYKLYNSHPALTSLALPDP